MSDYIRLKSTEVVQEQTPQTLASSHEAAQLALLLGEFAGLEKSLTAQLAVNATTRVNSLLGSGKYVVKPDNF
ncbi:hypothetical protein [Nostoc sp. WHI]|uniref:hypothetical protein n=1 Tax=Nostoc sp. WHI TaxID=2650611 RepID=UPI0018C810CC|nr:hypothetical protein [Nostoc sp. WHI]